MNAVQADFVNLNRMLLTVLQLWSFLFQVTSAGTFSCLFIDYNEPFGYTAIFLPSLKATQHLSEKDDSSVISASFFDMSMNEIPNGLERFKNLQRLEINVSNMKILDRDSLKGAKNFSVFLLNFSNACR